MSRESVAIISSLLVLMVVYFICILIYRYFERNKNRPLKLRKILSKLINDRKQKIPKKNKIPRLLNSEMQNYIEKFEHSPDFYYRMKALDSLKKFDIFSNLEYENCQSVTCFKHVMKDIIDKKMIINEAGIYNVNSIVQLYQHARYSEVPFLFEDSITFTQLLATIVNEIQNTEINKTQLSFEETAEIIVTT
ncbi:hypothetical protein A3Q56_00475 [Intoshia linei]|uniref:Uncharacterized protein n=1 Tax=Intoshia linei TaxID=1819745 RepID=A0A177BBR2_9BILA|nr:hypothetical protein A3Q56_00475 [Intoshia linei]